MIKLHWVAIHPTPYNDDLFRALAQDPAIDLTVHYVTLALAAYPWRSQLATGYRWRACHYRLGLDWRLLALALRDGNCRFIIQGWYNPALRALSTMLLLLGHPFAVWADAPNLQRRRSALKALLRHAWLKLVFRRAAVVLGAGQPALDNLKIMGCPERKLVNLPYVIDPRRYTPQPVAKADRPLTFISVARLHRDKGLDIALAALALARRERAFSFRYRIAGAGPERARLARQAAALGIAANVEFVGWLEPAALRAFYADADVLLHPARFEPYGVAVLEAMAAGLTVVCSQATGAARDRITAGVNGLAHRTGDAANLSRAISAVADNPQLRDQLGRAARATAAQCPLSRAVEIVKGLFSQA